MLGEWGTGSSQPIRSDLKLRRGLDYHIFISHASEDNDWCVKLAERLQEYGLKIWLDAWSVKPGMNLTDVINLGLNRSWRFIPVMTKVYFRKPWAQRELGYALNKDAADPEQIVIPIMREFCPVPPLLQNVVPIDFTADDQFNKKCRELVKLLHEHATTSGLRRQSESSLASSIRTNAPPTEVTSRNKALHSKYAPNHSSNPNRLPPLHNVRPPTAGKSPKENAAALPRDSQPRPRVEGGKKNGGQPNLQQDAHASIPADGKGNTGLKQAQLPSNGKALKQSNIWRTPASLAAALLLIAVLLVLAKSWRKGQDQVQHEDLARGNPQPAPQASDSFRSKPSVSGTPSHGEEAKTDALRPPEVNLNSAGFRRDSTIIIQPKKGHKISHEPLIAKINEVPWSDRLHPKLENGNLYWTLNLRGSTFINAIKPETPLVLRVRFENSEKIPYRNNMSK